MSRYWVSWYGDNGIFELHSPWWISGQRCSDDAYTFCAAVIADSEEAAQAVIVDAHDDKSIELEWRFCEPRAEDWSPFCDRFQRRDWMVWP